MYFLGYVELFHPKVHGFDVNSCNNIHGYYINIFTIKTPINYLFLMTKILNFEDIYEYSSREIICHKNILFHIKMRIKNIYNLDEHPFIRNFLKIQETLYNPTSLQIVEKIILKTGESICILKTFWIKCIQRKWKKICLYNKKVIIELMTLKNLKKRCITNIHNKFYGLRGMWSRFLPTFPSRTS